MLDVDPRWRSLVDDILRLHAPRPCRVWAFGSRVRGRARRFSDLDLACDAALLSDAFDESDLPWRVDLATCSDAFRRAIASHAVPFLDLAGTPPTGP